MNANQRIYRDAIRAMQRTQESLQGEINRLAETAVPELHFLNHKVSTFWECEKSPIGLCVWDISERGFHIDCICCFCGGPVERK